MVTFNIVVIGASGSLGKEFVLQLSKKHPNANIYAFSTNKIEESENIKSFEIDYFNEESIKEASRISTVYGKIDILIVSTGILHSKNIFPEKSIGELNPDNLVYLYKSNAVLPAMIFKYFYNKFNDKEKSICVVLSARLGSISDNKLGGWYSYRASKAALNMIIKNSAIETKRINQNAIIIGVQPGTVDSKLSKPFQKNVPKDKLFSPKKSVSLILNILDDLDPIDSGYFFSWDGKKINP